MVVFFFVPYASVPKTLFKLQKIYQVFAYSYDIYTYSLFPSVLSSTPWLQLSTGYDITVLILNIEDVEIASKGASAPFIYGQTGNLFGTRELVTSNMKSLVQSTVYEYIVV